MKLTEPIPILETWRDSKAGVWTKRNIRTTPSFGLVLGLFCQLPFGFAVLTLSKFWATFFFIAGVGVCMSMVILVNAAKEESPSASPLSVQRKQAIINSIKTRPRN